MSKLINATYESKNGFTYKFSKSYVTVTQPGHGYGMQEERSVSIDIPTKVFEDMMETSKQMKEDK